MLPELLAQIPSHEVITAVGGDGAYDTKGCHAAIAARGAVALIPTRKNGQLWKENTAGAKARNETLCATRRLGRTIWKRWSHYHRRSLVETKMRCFKLLGERVMARDFDRQVAELQVRAAVLESLHPARNTCDGARGINPSRVRGNSTCNGFVQQSPLRGIPCPAISRHRGATSNYIDLTSYYE